MRYSTIAALALFLTLVGQVALGAGPMTDMLELYDALKGETYQSEYIEKSDAQWLEELGEAAYHVLREHGTERAFTGEYDGHKADGVYTCAACGNHLFDSRHKFDSGTGWPSYFKPVDERNIGTSKDRKFFMVRTEVHCARCKGHLGHVFSDGPAPTGQRWCINSVSLGFVPRK